MCLRVPPRSWMPAPRSPAPAPAQLTGESAVRRDTAASPSSDLGLGAVWAQCWEGISDPRQLHGAEVPEDLVVPLWRPAPGREQGRARAERAGQPPARASKQHLASCSAQLRPLWARRRPTSTTQQQKACVSPPHCSAQHKAGVARRGSGGVPYLRSALQMCVTLERPMPLGSMRYWDVSTTALTPPSTCGLSCSTEMEMSRQAPRGRSVRQRLPTQRPLSRGARGQSKALGLGCPLPSPEHHAVPARVGGHAVRHVVINLHVLVQGLHHFALQQVLVPQVPLPEHPVQHQRGRRLDLRGDLPQAQRVPVPNLPGPSRRVRRLSWEPREALPRGLTTVEQHQHSRWLGGAWDGMGGGGRAALAAGEDAPCAVALTFLQESSVFRGPGVLSHPLNFSDDSLSRFWMLCSK